MKRSYSLVEQLQEQVANSVVAVRVTLKFHPIVNLMPFHHPAEKNDRFTNKNILKTECKLCWRPR